MHLQYVTGALQSNVGTVVIEYMNKVYYISIP
jgi:hypothetical protein